jgi:transcriptional regulator with XRE-family HTH domain
MNDELDMRKFAVLVRAKQGRRGLREVAREIGGISASTLSRIEQGKIPDLGTFFRLCQWLEVSPEEFMTPPLHPTTPSLPSAQMSTPELLTAHLRADQTLDPQTADALSRMIQLAYDAAAQGKLGQRQDKQ